jgi:hypothetical protein
MLTTVMVFPLKKWWGKVFIKKGTCPRSWKNNIWAMWMEAAQIYDL